MIPRPEFPNPQFERKNWINLNGEWDFEFDFGVSKKEAGILSKQIWDNKITVPYCPESKLSGIEYKDFMNSVWYRRNIKFTKEQIEGKIFLCFGAVDYLCTVYVNGNKAGVHRGGYTSFKIDITDYAVEGENSIIVNAKDDVRSPLQARGKQSEELKSHGCDYTRTTGIWQTVWIEFTPKNYIKNFKLNPDPKNKTLSVSAELQGSGKLEIKAYYNGMEKASVTRNAESSITTELSFDDIELWQPGDGKLYDLTIKFDKDEVFSYFGFRDIAIDGYKVKINGKSVYQRLVLDQGFYPDGIYTAPDDKDLIKDIELSFEVGFNGARLHQKVFEPRFLYHSDRMGYLVWGEYPNWGFDYSNPEVTDNMAEEWIEEIERDYNHPSIIGWCPFNETWDYAGRRQRNKLLKTIYLITKAMDKTRPCIDTSGNYHVITDIYDVHNYDQNVESFKKSYDSLITDNILFDEVNKGRSEYKGGPVFVSEYGGIGWSVDKDKNGWGYGNNPKSIEEFMDRYKGLTDALLDNEKMFGFCYTQLYDIEQEQNGLYTYSREAKFDNKALYTINSRKAAIED